MICKCRFIFGCLTAAVLCWSVQQPLLSQETRGHAAIEKYLDSQTLAIGWVDIGKIDVDKVEDFAARLTNGNTPPAAGDLNGASKERRARNKAMQQALLQHKVTRIYWLAEYSTLAQGPEAIVVPTPNAAAVAELLKSFTGSDQRLRFVQDGDAVVGGRQTTVDALLKKEGKVSPDLTAVLQKNEAANGLVALTPVPLTSALMVFPAVKAWTGAEPARASALAEALATLKSISLQTELPPDRASVRIQTQSADAARKTADFANKAIQSHLPDVAEQLTLSTEGADMTVKFDSLERSLAVYAALFKLFGVQSVSTQMDHMKMIALALHNYYSANRHLPPQALTDKAGKRLLSWRVLILPFVDESELYRQFRLDEPWDSEHNIKLAQRIPSVFNDLPQQEQPPRTRIVAPLMPDSVFGRPGAPVDFSEVRDGTSNTIWLVQADPGHAVIWTKPEDVTIDPENPLSAILDAAHKDAPVLVGLMDGSVQMLTIESLTKYLVPMLTIQGGEVLPSDLK